MKGHTDIIEELHNKVQTAISATNCGIWSEREGIIFARNADRRKDELKEIKAEEAERNKKTPAEE